MVTTIITTAIVILLYFCFIRFIVFSKKTINIFWNKFKIFITKLMFWSLMMLISLTYFIYASANYIPIWLSPLILMLIIAVPEFLLRFTFSDIEIQSSEKHCIMTVIFLLIAVSGLLLKSDVKGYSFTTLSYTVIAAWIGLYIPITEFFNGKNIKELGQVIISNFCLSTQKDCIVFCITSIIVAVIYFLVLLSDSFNKEIIG